MAPVIRHLEFPLVGQRNKYMSALASQKGQCSVDVICKGEAEIYFLWGHELAVASGKRDNELRGIEILRFLCAFSILLLHYQNFLFVGNYDGSQAFKLPLYWLLKYPYTAGSWAVQFFWVISGFIFYWKYAQSIFERRVGIAEFSTRRFSRLYPLHVVSLILVALLQWIYFRSHGQNFIYGENNINAFFAQIFFASNWFYWQGFSFNGPIWSVSVEILVYFTFFWTVWIFGAKTIVAAALSGVSLILMRSGRFHFVFSEAIFECAFLFFAGGVAQWLSQRRFALLLAACAGVSTVILLKARIVYLDFRTVSLLAISSVMLFAKVGEMNSGMVLRSFSFLGNATYSSYLIHFPIQLIAVIVVDALGYSRLIFSHPLVLATYLAIVIGISLGVYHLFELPAQNWIRRVLTIKYGIAPRAARNV